MKIVPMAILALTIVALPVAADDLTGTDHLLCAAVQANVCTTDGGCETGPSWAWNVPQFLEVDLAAKKVHTTATSGENRLTPIASLVREHGLIVLQGLENRRAFSVIINETTGDASLAVARDNLTVTVFGSCTPLPATH